MADEAIKELALLLARANEIAVLQQFMTEQNKLIAVWEDNEIRRFQMQTQLLKKQSRRIADVEAELASEARWAKTYQERVEGLEAELLNYQSIALQEGATKAAAVIKKQAAQEIYSLIDLLPMDNDYNASEWEEMILRAIKEKFGLE